MISSETKVEREDMEQPHEKTSPHPIKKEAQCGLCQRSFQKLPSIRKISRCEDCEKIGQRKRTQKREKRFKCGVCEQKFSRQARLTHHHHMFHNYRQHFCILCLKSFCSRDSFRQHLRLFHSGNEPRECQICRQKLSSYDAFADHLKKHALESQPGHKYEVFPVSLNNRTFLVKNIKSGVKIEVGENVNKQDTPVNVATKEMIGESENTPHITMNDSLSENLTFEPEKKPDIESVEKMTSNSPLDACGTEGQMLSTKIKEEPLDFEAQKWTVINNELYGINP